MVQQIDNRQTEQDNAEQAFLEERIENLRLEIEAFEQELQAVKEAKTAYTLKLMNDSAALERRLELLAGGYQGVPEFTEEQLEKVTLFVNTIRGIEQGIVERHRAAEQIQKTISFQQRLVAAQVALKPRIEVFNQCLVALEGACEELKAAAGEHEVNCEPPPIPGAARLADRKLNNDLNWTIVRFNT